MKPTLDKVTLICVDCYNHAQAVAAIRKSMQECDFASVKFLTDRDFEIEDVQVIKILPLKSKEEYSEFVFKELDKYIDTEFVLIARTDSAGALGLAEAIRRVRAFAQEGADAVFVELKASPSLLDDIAAIKAAVNVPVVVNMDSGGALAGLSFDGMKAAGIDLGIYPAMARGAFGFAMTAALGHLSKQGNMQGFAGQMFNSAQYNAALGIDEIEAWEKRFDR